MTQPIAPVGVSFPQNSSGVKSTSPAAPSSAISQVDPAVLKAAQGMEAMFLDFMMQVMRKTVPKNDLSFDSQAEQIYGSLLDTEMANRAARVGGVGLAEQIIAYLEASGYTQPKRKEAGNPTVPYRKQPQNPNTKGLTGGAPHESKSTRTR